MGNYADSGYYKHLQEPRGYLFLVGQGGEVCHGDGSKIKTRYDRAGYEVLQVSVGGRRQTHLVHRLVAMAHIPNPLNLPCVNHRDGNKGNNSIMNLEWCTHKANIDHAYKTGLLIAPRRTAYVELRERVILALANHFTQREIAEALNMTQANVSLTLKRAR